jgi:hypothetical protein
VETPYEIGYRVFEPPLLLGGDRFAHVRGEAGVPPGEELPHELLRDGVARDESRQQAVAERAYLFCRAANPSVLYVMRF